MDKERNPLKVGNRITADEVIGTIGKELDGNWTVTWTNKDISWDGFKGSAFDKAKEDFLGADFATNKGEKTIHGKQYVVQGVLIDGLTVYSAIDIGKTDQLPTPYINVDELSLTGHKTEWTVYLGNTVWEKALWKQGFFHVLAWPLPYRRLASPILISSISLSHLPPPWPGKEGENPGRAGYGIV